MLPFGPQAVESVHGITDGLGLAQATTRWLEQMSNLTWPNALPDVATLVRIWRAKGVSGRVLARVCRNTGLYMPAELGIVHNNRFPGGANIGWREAWEAIWQNDVSVPSPGELIFLLNVGKLVTADFERYMALQNVWGSQALNITRYLYDNKMPNPDDIIRYAVKDVWDPAAVTRFEYDASFPEEFGYWMKVQGSAGDSRRKDAQGNPVGAAIGWDRIAWRAHWANLSPTQMYEMYQRLRRNRIARFGGLLDIPAQGNQPAIPLREFTLNDLNLGLAVNDYPRPFRPQLAAIAYRNPRLVDIDRFWESRQIDAAEVYELHLDLGYSPADARLRTNWLIAQPQKGPLGQANRKLQQRIVRMYELGRLTADAAKQRLVQSGLDQAGADRQVQSADLEREIKEAQHMTMIWRKRFLGGMVNEAEVRRDMTTSGQALAWIDQAIAAWKLELAGGRLLLSTAKIRKLVVDGIIPLPTAEQYLTNLGWKLEERRYLMLEIQRDVKLQQEKLAERLARDRKAAKAAMARQAMMHERHRRDAINRLNRQASPPQLRRYYARGIIVRAELAAELQRRGYDDVARERQLADADIERDTYRRRRRRLAAEDRREQAPAPPAAPGG